MRDDRWNRLWSSHLGIRGLFLSHKKTLKRNELSEKSAHHSRNTSLVDKYRSKNKHIHVLPLNQIDIYFSLARLPETIEVSNLIVKLQIERGLSAVYLAGLSNGDSAINAKNIQRMNQARNTSNEVYRSMTRWKLGSFLPKKQLMLSNITVPLDGRALSTRQQFFSLLSWHRERINSK